MTNPDSPHLLRLLEERLLNRRQSADGPALATLLADDFYEIGRSGRVYDKAETMARLSRERDRHQTLSDLQIRFLGPDVALLVYLLPGQDDGASWHSSLWQCRDGRWQIQFHQGTPAPELDATEISSLLP